MEKINDKEKYLVTNENFKSNLTQFNKNYHGFYSEIENENINLNQIQKVKLIEQKEISEKISQTHNHKSFKIKKTYEEEFEKTQNNTRNSNTSTVGSKRSYDASLSDKSTESENSSEEFYGFIRRRESETTLPNDKEFRFNQLIQKMQEGNDYFIKNSSIHENENVNPNRFINSNNTINDFIYQNNHYSLEKNYKDISIESKYQLPTNNKKKRLIYFNQKDFLKKKRGQEKEEKKDINEPILRIEKHEQGFLNYFNKLNIEKEKNCIPLSNFNNTYYSKHDKNQEKEEKEEVDFNFNFDSNKELEKKISNKTFNNKRQEKEIDLLNFMKDSENMIKVNENSLSRLSLKDNSPQRMIQNSFLESEEKNDEIFDNTSNSSTMISYILRNDKKERKDILSFQEKKDELNKKILYHKPPNYSIKYQNIKISNYNNKKIKKT